MPPVKIKSKDGDKTITVNGEKIENATSLRVDMDVRDLDRVIITQLGGDINIDLDDPLVVCGNTELVEACEVFLDFLYKEHGIDCLEDIRCPYIKKMAELIKYGQQKGN